MFYFIRSILIYLVVFIAFAIGVQKAFVHFYADQGEGAKDGEPTSLTFALPSYMTQPRLTQTGLLLSGMAAQNRRDWGEAWQNFSSLNEKFDGNPTFALRAFTLALGNGEYDQALSIAQKLNDNFFAQNTDDTANESYDLVRLFLILNQIKSGAKDVDLTILKDGAVAKFTTPIFNAWLNPETITANNGDKDQIQRYNMALAADFHDKGDVAKVIFEKIDSGMLTVGQIRTVAVFYARRNMADKAIKLIEGTIARTDDVAELNVILKQLKDDPQLYKPQPYDIFHLNGIKAGLSLAFHDFAKALMVERAIDSALLFTRMASFMDPQSPSVYVTIGNILKYQGQDDAALDAYKKVSTDDELYNLALTNHVDILRQQEKFEQAEDILQKAIEADPENPNYHYLIGGIYKDQDKYKQAVEAFDAAETWGLHDGELERELLPLYYSRAIAFDLLDRWDDAERDLMTALDKFPNSPIILNYLGYSYADKNINLEKAKEMISQAVLAAPNDGYIIDSMGWILYRMGDYAEAVKYLERAARLRPYHMVINDHLGDAYWQVGRKLEARYMWQRAIDYYDDTEEEQQRMIDETRRKVKEGI